MNNRSFLTYEKVFAILGIIFFSGSMPPGILTKTSVSLLRYFLWFGSTLLLCWRWKTTWSVAKRSVLVWIVIGLSVFSFTWSDNPAFTKVVMREVLQMTSFGLYFASRFKLREQMHLVAIVLGVAGVLSVVYALGIPSVGISSSAKFNGAWKGVYNHKNTLGQFMSLGAMAFTLLAAERRAFSKRKQRFFIWSGLYLSIGLVALSQSKTALLICITSLLLLYAYRIYQKQGNKRRLYLEITVILSLVIFLVVSSSWEALLTSLGRDITLTGRTEIWGVALSELLDKNPLFGFGRGTFWAVGSHLAQKAGAAVGNKYIPPHAHNGYIDLALDIGFIGLVCFLISFLMAYKHAITRSFVSNTAKDLWPLAILSWLFFYNFTESSLMFRDNLFWPLYITAALCAKPSGRAAVFRLKH